MVDISEQTVEVKRQPVLFIPHGGGPCFFMDWPHVWDRMGAHLRGIGKTLPRRPSAIVVVSGHWETDRPTVTTGKAPPLIYDYYGFPEHTYALQYPAPGSPEVAYHVKHLLEDAGIASDEDDQRGFDHGVFIPFCLLFRKPKFQLWNCLCHVTHQPLMSWQSARRLHLCGMRISCWLEQVCRITICVVFSVPIRKRMNIPGSLTPGCIRL